jgi:hypothetical protein
MFLFCYFYKKKRRETSDILDDILNGKDKDDE